MTPELATGHPTVNPSIGRRASLPRVRAALILAMWVISAFFLGASLITARVGGPDDPLPAVVIGVAALSFATTGAILASRLPGNPIGWFLASGGLCLALGDGASGVADAGLTVHPGGVPGAIWFAWLSQWIWAPAIGSVVGLALVYPSGRLLSSRWRPVALAAVVVIALLSIGSAIGPWSAGSFPIQNPLLGAGDVAAIVDDAAVPTALTAALVALLAVASLVIRYRHGGTVERAQLKWFAAIAAFSVPAFFVGTALFGTTGVAVVVSNVAFVSAFTGFALMPVAIGIAILRYRLYEIDRLISRGLSYGVVTAILGGLFVGVVLGLQAILAPFTGSNTFAVAGSTLLVAAVFQPLRRRVQRLVDRRFNRTRYDAERTVADFAGRLRGQIDLEQLRSEILATIDAAVEPSSVSLWLRE
jgi:hypothetical protein